MSLLLISDLHGAAQKHIDYTTYADHEEFATLQIGDLGYNYDYLINIDPNKHKFFPGNHENYEDVNNHPHNLGDYGHYTHGDVDFFFVRGEFSIDKNYREKMYHTGQWPRTWFPEEEINRADHPKVLNEYKKYIKFCELNDVSPVIISHGCPKIVSEKVGRPHVLRNFGFDPKTFHTETQYLLDSLLDYHSPDLWVFGHYHRDFDKYVDQTRFVCIRKAGTFLITPNIKDSDFYDFD
jgi:predicted phosphodiesterase